MTADSFDSDYPFLAPGPRELLRKAIQAGNDSAIEQSGLAPQQVAALKRVAARHRQGLKTTVQEYFGG